ncbi:DUF2147 domain-containing protein [Parafilimonas sp.]|uniref:DUF2147 domain-containing protein n=1 Tax=Parafilimonas sp. TaxID=1969739 RepID=UPI0039E47709
MKYITVIALLLSALTLTAQNNPDAILGKWESSEKNLIVEVYKQHNNFQARIIWFNNPGNLLPETDIKNPDKDLRSRKIVGMDVLSGLEYNAKQNRWTGGKIYDCTSGHTWSATVWLASPDELNVRGFYLVRWLGKTMLFTKAD